MVGRGAYKRRLLSKFCSHRYYDGSSASYSTMLNESAELRTRRFLFYEFFSSSFANGQGNKTIISFCLLLQKEGKTKKNIHRNEK